MPQMLAQRLKLKIYGFSKERSVTRKTVHANFPKFWMVLQTEMWEASPEQMEHHISEIKTLMLYRHENIVQLYGFAVDGDEICLVYQYMDNGSLEDRLQCKVREGGLHPPRRLRTSVFIIYCRHISNVKLWIILVVSYSTSLAKFQIKMHLKRDMF